MTYQKILVPLADISDSEKVFVQALAMARHEGSSLMLLHCLPLEVFVTPYGNFTAEELSNILPEQREHLEKEKQLVIEWLSAYAQKASAQGIATQWELKVGEASFWIREIAETWQADLIVMGRRGLSGISEVLMGSVSNYVVHHVPCSVLLVQLEHKQ